MKSRLFFLIAAVLLSACAGTPNGHEGTAGAADPNSVYNDPTYPGSGVHIGIGAGSWGGRSGGGIGIGLGF